MQPPPPEEQENPLRFPWWSYPLAAAAMILLAFIVWWGQLDGPPEPRARGIASAEPDTQIDRPAGGMWDWDDRQALSLQRSWWTGYEQNGLQFDDNAWASAEEPQIDDVQGIFMSPMTSERVQ